MKKLCLVGSALLGVAAASATPIDLTFTGTAVTFTVPTTDIYQILASGAQGWNGHFSQYGRQWRPWC
jgi:hypothetical protein